MSEGWKKQWSNKTRSKQISIWPDRASCLACWPTLNQLWTGQPEMVQQMLEDITDLSSDEDSPTVNTGGYCMPSTQDTLLELPQLLCMVRQQLSCAGVTQKAQKAVEMKSSPLRLWCWPCGHWRWEPTHGSGYASRFALCTSHRITGSEICSCRRRSA